jgi:ribosomal protein L11 methyltransferase
MEGSSLLRRVSVTVLRRRAEEARAAMLELFPQGFEEVEGEHDVELVAYTDGAGEERLWHAFGGARVAEVEPGWEERWRSFHRPIRVGPLWIGPPWEQAPARATAVVIDPGRAFGTGAHGTTRLCLELLLDQARGSLVDLGCGSGVLAIAAAKLGFAPVVALDVDPVAVEVARQNVAANEVGVEVILCDAVRDALPAARTAVANIALGVVASIAPRLRCDWLVSSGYLVSDVLSLPGFVPRRRVDGGGWAADLWQRESE